MSQIKRRRGGHPNWELREVAASSELDCLLDLVHVTAVGSAREILEGGKIEMRACPVFGQELVYFFVGRPVYKLKQGEEKSEQISRFPFAFIISPRGLDAPYHVYPFDTGAAADGIFGERPDPFVYLDDYELEPSLDAVRAHIAWAFGSNQQYYDGSLKPGLKGNSDEWKLVLRSFVTIAELSSNNRDRPDGRASSVEIAYKSNIELKGNLKFVIFPKQYMESATNKNIALIEKLQSAGTDWDTYDWQPNVAPNIYSAMIEKKMKRYLEKIAQIKSK